MRGNHLFLICAALSITTCTAQYVATTSPSATAYHTQNTNTLNIIILIDSGTGEEYTKATKGKYGAISGRLHQALLQCSSKQSPAIIIANTALMYCLATFNKNDSTHNDFATIAKDWETYLLNDQEDFINPKNFAVFIPKELSSSSLKELNLSADKLMHLESTSLLDTFSQQEHYCTPYDPQNVLKIMDLTGYQRPKCIYLSGHGLEQHRIAGMQDSQYQQTLQLFNQMNTIFLYVASCEAGGKNLLLMHNLIKKPEQLMDSIASDFSLSSMTFTLAIGSVTDAVQFEEKTPHYFNIFFAAIDSYISAQASDKVKNKYLIVKKLSQALYSMMPYANNIPLIRLPHQSYLFRAVSFDTTYALTSSKYLAAIKSAKKEPQLLISAKKTNLLLYPVHLEGITINTTSTPLVISMIPGTAQHYIDQIKSNCNTISTIEKMFCRAPTPGYYAQSAKAWFIKQLTCSCETITGVAIHKRETYHQEYAKFTVLMKSNNKYLRYIVKGILGLQSPEEISPSTYEESLKQIQESTRALPDALSFATNKREGPETELAAFQHFLPVVVNPAHHSATQGNHLTTTTRTFSKRT